MDENSKSNRGALSDAQVTEVRTLSKPRRRVGAKRSSDEIKDHISRQLKTAYNDVLQQPVPDRFAELIRQLKAKEEGKE